MNCPRCGTANPQGAVYCMSCGGALPQVSQPPPLSPSHPGSYPSAYSPPPPSQYPQQRTSTMPENAIVVLILNLFFPGIGTMIAGYGGRGTIQLLLWFLLWWVFGLPWLIAFVWALIDSINYMQKGKI